MYTSLKSNKTSYLSFTTVYGGTQEENCAAILFHRQGQDINLNDTFGSLVIDNDLTNKDNLIASHGKLMDVPCNSKRQVQCGFQLHYDFVELKKNTYQFDSLLGMLGQDPDDGKISSTNLLYYVLRRTTFHNCAPSRLLPSLHCWQKLPSPSQNQQNAIQKCC